MARDRRDDDDYDDRRPPSGGGGGGTVVKVIAIIGGVLLVITLICGGLVYYMFYLGKKAVTSATQAMSKMAEEAERQRLEEANSNKGKSKKAGEQFMQEVKGNRYDAAFKLTTKEFQQRVNLKDFTALIKKYSTPLKQTAFLQEEFGVDKNKTTYTFTEKLSVPGQGFKDLSITVIKDGNDWKVDQFSIDNDDGT